MVALVPSHSNSQSPSGRCLHFPSSSAFPRSVTLCSLLKFNHLSPLLPPLHRPCPHPFGRPSPWAPPASTLSTHRSHPTAHDALLHPARPHPPVSLPLPPCSVVRIAWQMLAILRQRLAPRALKPLARQASSYSEKMDKTGRPISPHVFIYRFPTIAISSIMVRISGVMLTVGAKEGEASCAVLAGTSGIAYSALLAGSQTTADLMTELGNSSVGTLAKFAVAYPLVYHVFGAARHAVWDLTGKGFSNQQMLHSSYAIAGASTLLSIAIATVSLSPPKKK